MTAAVVALIMALLAMALLAIALMAQAGGRDDRTMGDVVAPGTVPSPTNPPTGDPTGVLSAFEQACDESVQPGDWVPGQVDYPSAVDVALGASATYRAAVDIRVEPLAPELVIDSEDAASEEVVVQCLISARLESSDPAVEISSSASAIEGWYAQEFSPSGVAEWTWTLEGIDPAEAELTLVVRPATSVDDLLRGVPTGERSFVTDVHVTATGPQHVAHWVQGKVAAARAALASLAIAVAGLLAFLTNSSDLWAKIRPGKRKAGGPTDGA